MRVPIWLHCEVNYAASTHSKPHEFSRLVRSGDWALQTSLWHSEGRHEQDILQGRQDRLEYYVSTRDMPRVPEPCLKLTEELGGNVIDKCHRARYELRQIFRFRSISERE